MKDCLDPLVQALNILVQKILWAIHVRINPERVGAPQRGGIFSWKLYIERRPIIHFVILLIIVVRVLGPHFCVSVDQL